MSDINSAMDHILDDAMVRVVTEALDEATRNPEIKEALLDGVKDSIRSTMGNDIADGLDPMIVTEEATIRMLAAHFCTPNPLATPWVLTEDGTYERFMMGMRYCVHPDSLMLTTWSFDPGIVMFDAAPDAFETMLSHVRAECGE